MDARGEYGTEKALCIAHGVSKYNERMLEEPFSCGYCSSVPAFSSSELAAARQHSYFLLQRLVRGTVI